MTEAICPSEAVFGGDDEERYPCTHEKGHEGPHSWEHPNLNPPSVADLRERLTPMPETPEPCSDPDCLRGHRHFHVGDVIHYDPPVPAPVDAFIAEAMYDHGWRERPEPLPPTPEWTVTSSTKSRGTAAAFEVGEPPTVDETP